jgi:predicted metal-dependent peptidase
MAKPKGLPRITRAREQFFQGRALAEQHPLFGPLLFRASVVYRQDVPYPREGWARVGSDGTIYVHPERIAEPEEWLYVLAHCLLHLGFNHFQERFKQREWDLACDCIVWQFLRALKLGKAPEALRSLPEVGSADLPGRTEEDLFRYFCENGIAKRLPSYSLTGTSFADVYLAPKATPKFAYARQSWEEVFGYGLSQAVASAVDIAGGVDTEGRGKPNTPAQRARRWFISSYPLLGALAASFKLIEDPAICRRMQISVAAINDHLKEIYFSPGAGLNDEEARFVMAHELLHAALRHSVRRRGRDPELWNVACDYVINEWLVEMKIGALPPVGLLLDAKLAGLSSESVYDRIVTDLRRYRKLGTFRGVGLCDLLDAPEPEWWATQEGVELDEFYRSCLAQGLRYHCEGQRGLLPAGLLEEIHALSQPPIPWEVELARWFDNCFPPEESYRTYARPSRRQSSTPDIPRPRYVAPDDDETRTFGVVLDTSGSMNRRLLGEALGAVASYSESRRISRVRLVFCDVGAYDAGYVRPYDIAGSMKVRGRGGTVLQPGIDLLERAPDFPADGPILIITDGFCDRFHSERKHAILLPEGRGLPFAPRGKVFRLQ